MPDRGALLELHRAAQRILAVIAIISAGALTIGPTRAQSIPDQIDSVISDQDQIIRRYSAPRKPGTIDLSVTDARKKAPPADARKIKFTLRSVTVRGAVTVANETLRAAWAAI